MTTSHKARSRRATTRGRPRRKGPALEKRAAAPPNPTEVRAVLPRMTVISLPAGTATVSMQTTDLQIPFHVGIDGETLMVGSFSQNKEKGLSPGTHHVTWFINHIEDEWSHKLTIRSGAQPPKTLDARALASGDPGISSDVVAIVAA